MMDYKERVFEITRVNPDRRHVPSVRNSTYRFVDAISKACKIFLIPSVSLPRSVVVFESDAHDKKGV